MKKGQKSPKRRKRPVPPLPVELDMTEEFIKRQRAKGKQRHSHGTSNKE